jgi:hypothetical protein
MKPHTIGILALAIGLLAAAAPADAQLVGHITELSASSDSEAVGRAALALASGRLLLDGLSFDDADRLDRASTASLRAVAKAMKATSGGYVVRVRTTAPLGAQNAADRRAAAIRLLIVSDGVEAERLFSAGSGSTGIASSRAEILRIK